MQEIAEPLRDMGATLVAITPEVAKYSLEITDTHGLSFDLLSDPANAYSAELGLKFAVPSDVVPIYGGFGIDLPTCNGDDSWTLPMPARLVVDGSGVVRAADIDPDYTRRPEPQKTIDDVKALSAA